MSLALGASADVRVPAATLSEGFLVCGASIQITAAVTDGAAAVALTGDGTGTPGFDEGSIGETGERFLIESIHFACGDSVVIRIDDDGTGETAAAGRLAVVAGGDASPFDPIDAPDDGDGGDGDGEDGDGGDDPDGPTTISLVVDNHTGAFIKVNVLSADEEEDAGKDVFLPEGGRSEGTVSCSSEFTITAHSLVPEALTGLLDEVLIILTGDGTGAEDFDSGSIGNLGQRLLESDVHFACGDTVTLTITDPGEPGFSEPSLVDTNGETIGFEDINSNGVQDAIADRLGAGTVSVD